MNTISLWKVVALVTSVIACTNATVLAVDQSRANAFGRHAEVTIVALRRLLHFRTMNWMKRIESSSNTSYREIIQGVCRFVTECKPSELVFRQCLEKKFQGDLWNDPMHFEASQQSPDSLLPSPSSLLHRHRENPVASNAPLSAGHTDLLDETDVITISLCKRRSEPRC